MINIQHYAALIQDVNKMQSRLESIAYNFKEIQAKTDLDTQLIDALVATANNLLSTAETIKLIEYDPTSEDDDTSGLRVGDSSK
tara:strand:+ start:488 stop:739 length:252 start_codon:yes stop_codon:yes gene_type:complete